MTEMQKQGTGEDPRWTMLRDLGVLQVKLIVDGLRDLILVPASLIAGVASLVSAKDGRPGPQLYHLLGFGKQTEAWINLFGAFKNAPEEIVQSQPFADADIDDIVGKLETFVVDEVKRGGVTKQAKQRLDKLLNALQRDKPSD